MNEKAPQPPQDGPNHAGGLLIAHRIGAALCALEAVALVAFAVWVLAAGRSGPVDFEAGVIVFVLALAGILGYLAWALFRGDTRGRGAALTLQVIFVLMMRIPGESFWVVLLARLPFLVGAITLVAAIYLENRDENDSSRTTGG
jgi:hypothetical protein